MFVDDALLYPCCIATIQLPFCIDQQLSLAVAHCAQSSPYRSLLLCFIATDQSLRATRFISLPCDDTTLADIQKQALSLCAADFKPAPQRLVDTVSVVVPSARSSKTLNRCIASLLADNSVKHPEIIVVINQTRNHHHLSLEQYWPNIKFLYQPKRGSSSARNMGFAEAINDIILFVDDDVEVPKHWMGNLVAGFNDGITLVSGNVLPARLETRAEFLFEVYGGLGSSAQEAVFDGNWLANNAFVPQLGKIGCTVNFGIRRHMLLPTDRKLFDESLGAGVPAGGAEDLEMFHRLLRHGHRLKFMPQSFVWHHHRQTDAALRQQLFNYGKALTVYQSRFRFSEDIETISRSHLIMQCLRNCLKRFRRQTIYPAHLRITQLAGQLLGPVIARNSTKNSSGKSE